MSSTALQPSLETFDQEAPSNAEIGALNSEPVTVSLESVTQQELKYKLLMAKGFVQGALRDHSQGNASRYNELIGQLLRKHNLPNAPSTVQLYVWIKTLSDCVSQLDKSCHELVVAVLHVDWSVRSVKFVDAYIRFMKNVVSAHSFYVVPVLNAIVEGFRYRPQLPPYNTTTRSVTYVRYHEALREILALIPTASSSLYVSIQRHIPFRQRSTADQAAYIKNILNVMDYVPTLRRQIMTLLVDHLIKIDAHIQIELDDMKEDVEFDTYNMNFDDDYQSDNSDDESDSSDDDDINNDGSEVDSDFEEKEDVTKRQTKKMNQIKSMVRRLDSLMQLVFTHFSQSIRNDKHQQYHPFADGNANTSPSAGPSATSLQTEMYHILLDSFDRTVLKTLRSRYTQFLLFYICSLDPSYADGFAAHLFQHLTDPLRPNVTRIAASSYISSYVARAKFMKPETIQQIMGNLSEWCILLLDQYEAATPLTLTGFNNNNSNNNNTSPLAGKHEVFYASIQAIMYIFCFRWRDLVLEEQEDDYEDDLVMEGINDHHQNMTNATVTTATTSVNRKWCPGLRHVSRILTSRLYPLKVCSKPVVDQFLKVARQTNFMYLYTHVETRKDLLLPGVNVDVVSQNGARNLFYTMQTFFPFDPYKLEGSKKFIEDIYFEWIPQDGQEGSDDDSEDDESESEDDEVDDMSAGTAAMSISPSPNHFL